MDSLKLFIKLAFLLITSLIIFIYFGLLHEKIVRPNFKNMGTEGFFFWGFVVLIMITLDVFIVRNLIYKMKSRKK
ncbi:Phenylalanyl-tRNA synthetase subunit alpha [Pontibacter korlensis]|uniref:Uncharacterized protein n=1 Tax=Pontibacter korlensis TaxID=400092 RepID=A0A0E3ZGM3_9BACT|nr:hypothetical protein PKOR_10660 [Pontibacter korlensis]